MPDQIDRNLVIENTAFDENMQVYDVTKAPFLLYGNSKAAKNIFSRMDEESAAKVSPAVENRGARIPLADGSNIPVTDYASAGKTWAEDKRIAVWLRNQ